MGQRGPDSSPKSCPPGRKFTPTRSGAQAAISWKLWREGICASRLQSSHSVPSSSSVGILGTVVDLDSANKASDLAGASATASAEAPVRQNSRRVDIVLDCVLLRPFDLRFIA